MNWKKKLLALGLSLALILSLTACGQKAAEPEQPEEPCPNGRTGGRRRRMVQRQTLPISELPH